MCNKILWDPELNPVKIPEKGIGWKVFWKINTSYHQMFYIAGYKTDNDDWITWDPCFGNLESAFCFFLKKEDAEKLKQEHGWRFNVVEKIEYEQGIQERTQTQILSGTDSWRMALCKRFRIVEETTNV